MAATVGLDKYLSLAEELGMANARLLGPDQVYWDPRAVLKCRWGCEDYFNRTIKCSTRGTTIDERRAMLERYSHILLLHGHDAHELSKAVLAIERAAFLDGLYFAFGVRYCRLCRHCAVDDGKQCIQPQKVRPCDQAFGLDMYQTARAAGLPCQVLQDPEDQQNRYGLVLLS